MSEGASYVPVRYGVAESVSGWAFEELSRRIVVGQLAPGEKITEEALVRDLGVSRTPLREAIKQLEELGLIVRQRNRTLRVAPLQSEELIELVRLREHVEGLVAAEAARKVAAGEIGTDALRAIIRAIEDAETGSEGLAQIDRIFDLGTQFHAKLVTLAAMPRVARIHAGLQLALARYRLVNARDKRRLNHRSAEHRGILEAVESGDPGAAEAAMRLHIREGLRAYTSNPDDGFDRADRVLTRD
ncbi:GntR family transcriptional regulator [Marinivivus vitaminiproducens]|uniref:GntR family transcriptional regulator n=1 Tax=Marinivivus vitaminiproducens TaxID=3035935 RepID=UPI0027993E87|nr:GntR family transcriptional regulator [Geminicoccaceae bacterium SCSIO 64248]